MKSKNRKNVVAKNRKKDRRDFSILLVSFLSVFFVVFFSFWLGKQLYDFRSKAAVNSWADNDRSLLKTSQWFTQHSYGDCSSEAGDFWPISRADCLINEPSSGPTASDQVVAPEPTGLYYKHLLPTDFIRTIPSLLLNIDFTGITKQSLENILLQAVQQNPTKFANISVDSLDVGLEGGNTGTVIRSLTLYVHPQLERPISSAIGVLPRAKNLYQPFIEGATGATISDVDLGDLYTAALNRCGNHSLNGDQSGLGVFKTVGDYVVVVQVWNIAGGSSLFDGDCNIHVVKIASVTTVSPSPPGAITPTFGCLGPCVPTSVPSQIPTVPVLPSVTPTITPTPPSSEPITPIITPEVSPTGPPGNSGGGFDLIKLILALLQLIIAFFAGLLSGGR